MNFFIDTADIDAIRQIVPTGLVDGVTTNPSLIAKSGHQILDVISWIAHEIDGPVSAEVASTDYATMMREAHVLRAIADSVVVKVPLTSDGLRACRELTGRDIQVNVTLCFSAVQALLAAKCGATFISPFVGRLDDAGADGLELIRDIRAIYDQHGFETQILAASIRSSNHVKDAALAGADVVTVPPSLIDALYNHPLTDRGLADFVSDWTSTGQSIV